MTRRSTTKPVPRTEARAFLAKARRFLAGARQAGRNHDAAMLAAIHAGISAADAACVALIGKRSAGPDHMAAAMLLEQTGSTPDVREQAQRLRRLVSMKARVEYEAAEATATQARDALRRATTLVTWAEETIDKAGF